VVGAALEFSFQVLKKGTLAENAELEVETVRLRSEAVLLNKIDLAPYSGVSLDELRRNLLEVSPETVIFPTSCRTGEGVEAWIDWLKRRIASSRARRW
jgi:hydrogenase nickel incorporation protein HypB